MFSKKKCGRCGKKISDKYSFCPNCGNSLNKQDKKEEWGMLGKNDFMRPMDDMKLPMGFNMLFNSLMKNLDKQFKNLDNEVRNDIKKNKMEKGIKKSGISINISTSGDSPPKIRVQSFGDNPKFRKEEKQIKNQIRKIPSVHLSKESKKRFSELPREEPSTNVRRLSDKVIYEIKIPGVKSVKDISIVPLENSIEVKAVSKNKAYSKIIPIGLPLVNYFLSKGKLVLELGEKAE